MANELKELGMNPVIIRKYYKQHADEHSLIINKFNNLILKDNRIEAIKEAKKKNFKKDKNSYSVSIGQFGKILSILKSNNCKKVLFAGKGFAKDIFRDVLGIHDVHHIAIHRITDDFLLQCF